MTTRRAMLAGSAIAAALSPAAALAAPSPDAELIALAAAYVAVMTEADAITTRFASVLHMPPDAEEREAALSREAERLRIELGGTRANTLAGVLAKAAAFMILVDPAPDDPMSAPRPDDHYFLPWSLCRDLLAAGGVAFIAENGGGAGVGLRKASPE